MLLHLRAKHLTVAQSQFSKIRQQLSRFLMFMFQIFSDMLSELDFDSDGQISLEEWLKGGMENIPLQVLLGLDVVSI